MIIKTNKGTFKSFRDIRTDMRVEKYDSIFIESVNWWGTELIVGGGAVYSKEEIDKIIEDDF